MEWLLDQAERCRVHLRAGPFFRKVACAERPAELQWVHQLYHQSREFTQALCLRYSLCHDPRYQSIFADHAFEEADHPQQLAAWMGTNGFLDGIEAGGIQPTPETLNSLAFCWRSAVREPHDLQVVALNVLSEGVALDFYSVVIPVLARLDLLTGRYWKVHREVDSHHLQLGLDRCGDVAPDSPTGVRYQRVLWHGANLYHQMLNSWVGESVEPLVAPWEESLTCRSTQMTLGVRAPLSMAQGTKQIPSHGRAP